jgi:hypothetical protein
MKKWIAKVQLYWDASCVVSIEVKANTERKARIFAEKKLSKNMVGIALKFCQSRR